MYDRHYYDEEPDYEKEWLKQFMGDDWIEDDNMREALDGHPDAYWNID